MAERRLGKYKTRDEQRATPDGSLNSFRAQRTAAFIGGRSRDQDSLVFDRDRDWDENVTSIDHLGIEVGDRTSRANDMGKEPRKNEKSSGGKGKYNVGSRDMSSEEDEGGFSAEAFRRSPSNQDERDRRVSMDVFSGFSRSGDVQERIRRTMERREEMETWHGGRLASREAWSETHESHEDINTQLDPSDNEDPDDRVKTTRRFVSSNEEKRVVTEPSAGPSNKEKFIYTGDSSNKVSAVKKSPQIGTASMTLSLGLPEAVNGEIARATVPKHTAGVSGMDSWSRNEEHRRTPLYSAIDRKKKNGTFRETERDSYYFNNLISGQEDRESSTAGLTVGEIRPKRWFGLHANLSWVYAALLIAVGIALIAGALLSPLIAPFAFVWFLLVLILIGLIALIVFFAWIAYKRSKENKDGDSSDPRDRFGVGSQHSSNLNDDNGVPRSDLNPSYISSGNRSERAKRWPNIGHVPLLAAIMLLGLCAFLFAIFWFVLHVYLTCMDDVFEALAILACIFILLQLPLLYKNRQMNELKSHFLAKWGMMHLFAVDVLLAFLAVFFIIDYHIRFRTLSGNYSNLTCDQIDNFTFIHARALRICEFDHSFSKQFYFASLALYPLFIIFLFLACVILVFSWKNLSSQYRYYREDDRSLQSWVGSRAHGALAGAILGGILILATIITIVLFFVFFNSLEDPESAFLSFRGVEFIINIIIVILLVITPWLMRKMGIDHLKDMSLYTVIFVFALIGLLLYETFYAIACNYFGNSVYIMGLVKSIISIIAATFQTVFLLVCMRFYCRTATQIHEAPGRSMITLLLMCNISLILLNIFENFINEFNLIPFHVYGLLAWTIIQHILIPFQILFRIICSIATIIIWTKSYEIPRKAFASPNK